MQLAKNEIIGQKLARIVQSYQLLDGWIDLTDNVFVLDSGIAFRFPFDGDAGFTATEVPDDAKDVVHPEIRNVLCSTINGFFRAPHDVDYHLDGPDVFRLRVHSGFWVWQTMSAPHGTGGAGLWIGREPPENPAKMIDFWDIR